MSQTASVTDQVATEILTALQQHGALRLRELQEATDIHPAMVQRMCHRLSSDGLTRMPQTGMYELTDRGRSVAADGTQSC